MQIPRVPNPITTIVRAVQKRYAVAPNTGVDGFGVFDMQYTYSPGSTTTFIAGTAVYNDSLPNVTDFTNLFDQYRISKVTVRFDIAMGVTNSALSPGYYLPRINYVADYDDNASALNADLLQYPQYQVHDFMRDGYTPLMFEFSPVPLLDVAGTGVSTTYGPMRSAPWLRTASVVTPHYGMKLYIDFQGAVGNTTIPLVMTVWYTLQFTNPK